MHRLAIIRSIIRHYRAKLLLTYLLLQIEELLRIAQPFVLGIAVNDLLNHSFRGLWLFVLQHVAYMCTGIFRQVYDTRVFTAVYGDLASRIVQHQKKRNVETSLVSARTSLSRQFVDFFEQDIPLAVRSFYSFAGSLIMLTFYDSLLVWCCLGLMVPAALINFAYSKRTLEVTEKLHDQLEQEVAVIQNNDQQRVREHFQEIGRFRVKQSNLGAANFGSMEGFVLLVMVLALILLSRSSSVQAGTLLAVFQYVIVFITSLDAVPVLVLQFVQMKDVAERLKSDFDIAWQESPC